MLTNRISIFSPKNVQSNSAPTQVGKKISQTCIFSRHLRYVRCAEKCKPIPGIGKPFRGHALPFRPSVVILTPPERES